MVIDVDVVTYVAKVQSFEKNTIKLGGKFFLHKDGQLTGMTSITLIHFFLTLYLRENLSKCHKILYKTISPYK